jgi:hypothetical protein
VGLIDEKTEGRKSCATVPVTMHHFSNVTILHSTVFYEWFMVKKKNKMCRFYVLECTYELIGCK